MYNILKQIDKLPFATTDKISGDKLNAKGWNGSVIAQAFFGSIIMNVTFGPMMMTFHRFAEMFIDLKLQRKWGRVTLTELVDKNDWLSLVEFAWLKTCIFFWIPVHTVVFLLPGEYRVLISAFLSIALGLLLAFAQIKNRTEEEVLGIHPE